MFMLAFGKIIPTGPSKLAFALVSLHIVTSSTNLTAAIIAKL